MNSHGNEARQSENLFDNFINEGTQDEDKQNTTQLLTLDAK
jgi:hypothetical protein